MLKLVTAIVVGAMGLSVGFGFSRYFKSMFDTALYSIVYVTGPTEEFSKKLAQDIVKNKLAACVNIIPKVISVYEWENKMNEDDEVLMIIKTMTSKVPELSKFIKDNHPYEICEVIATPIVFGNEDYLKWIRTTVSQNNITNK